MRAEYIAKYKNWSEEQTTKCKALHRYLFLYRKLYISADAWNWNAFYLSYDGRDAIAYELNPIDDFFDAAFESDEEFNQFLWKNKRYHHILKKEQLDELVSRYNCEFCGKIIESLPTYFYCEKCQTYWDNL